MLRTSYGSPQGSARKSPRKRTSVATILLREYPGGMSTIDHPVKPDSELFTLKVRSTSRALGSQAKLATWAA